MRLLRFWSAGWSGPTRCRSGRSWYPSGAKRGRFGATKRCKLRRFCRQLQQSTYNFPPLLSIPWLPWSTSSSCSQPSRSSSWRVPCWAAWTSLLGCSSSPCGWLSLIASALSACGVVVSYSSGVLSITLVAMSSISPLALLVSLPLIG